MADANAEAGQRFQERFDLFVLGLTFSILGLSIQTATFGRHVAGDCFEMAGWVSLLVSGLAGLWRGSWTPQVHFLYSKKSETDQNRDVLERSSRVGQPIIDRKTGGQLSPAELLKGVEKGAARLQSMLDGLDKKLSTGYRVQRASFLAGLVFLIFSRGLDPFLGVVSAIRTLIA